MRRVAAARAGIEGQLRRARVAAETEDVLPGAVVGCARRLGAQAGGVIEQLLDRDLRLARVAQRLRPGDELKRRIVKAHLLRRQPLVALLGGNRQHRRADRLRDRGHAAGIRLGAVASLNLEHDVAPANHDRREVALVALQQPLLQFVQLRRVHAGNPANVLGLVELRQPPCDSGGGK